MWITVHKRHFFLKELLGAVYIKLDMCSLAKFVLRHPGGVDLTATERFCENVH